MDLRDYVRLLRVRRTLILACTLIGVAAAAVATLTATPIYRSTTKLFVSTGNASSAGEAFTSNQFAQQRVKTYQSILDSPLVTEAVVDELGLQISPIALAGKISASAPLDTVLVNVSVEDPSPVLAQRIANSVAANFIRAIPEIEKSDASGESIVKVTVVSPASLPGAPVSPRKTLNLALGLLAGLSAGIGAAVARETLDTSVKGVEELQDTFRLATLGVIPFDQETKQRPLVTQLPTNAARPEAFRQLRTNLQFVDVDARPRSIVITSAVPQEGKSTTAVNLALTLSQAGVPTILVEADLRRPKVGEYLGLEGAAGLTDVLIGRAPLDDVLQPWGDGRLKVLLSGPLPPNPAELLGSRHMAEMLATLEQRALVLIDAPPLLPVTDAAVLATEASGALVIVAARRTRREQLAQAMDALKGVGAHVFGAIITMAPARGPDSYRYGYGYGEGYTYVLDNGVRRRREKLAAPVAVEPRPPRPPRPPQPPAGVASPRLPGVSS
jgi:polysaccharide biosynthesis transport protein